jgi:hypothetical protein
MQLLAPGEFLGHPAGCAGAATSRRTRTGTLVPPPVAAGRLVPVREDGAVDADIALDRDGRQVRPRSKASCSTATSRSRGCGASTSRRSTAGWQGACFPCIEGLDRA